MPSDSPSPDRPLAWLRLALTRGLGPKGAALLRRALDAESMPLEDFFALHPAERTSFWRARGGERIAHALDIPPIRSVEPLRRRLDSSGVRWLGADDPAFPQRLTNDPCDPPPPVLFWRGDLALLDALPTVGFSGRTDPTAPARRATRDLAARLARDGWLAVSGLARGVDRAAHEGALDAGGATAAFLPQGILAVDLPGEMAGALDAGRLLLLSPWIPTAPWTASLAVRRNALIAQCADGLIAGEMAPDSDGTRHTVREAQRRRRPAWTFALRAPGRSTQSPAVLFPAGVRPLRLDESGAIPSSDYQSLLRALRKSRRSALRPAAPAQPELFP
ncbi:MAG: DNA-processing protein DprA [Candidatus Sumerlaeota bacterium]|nr:DNA-processing protein DprA [Candidatus Sumerlaeota bacterium]